MSTYIDKKGNFVNYENLSLREIYELGKKDGAAYDINNVIGQLEEMRENAKRLSDVVTLGIMTKVIDIVKKGAQQ